MKGFVYISLFSALIALLLPSCFLGGRKKLNRNVTFWQRDSIPYGTSVALQQLKYIFPEAYIEVSKAAPVLSETGYSLTDSASKMPKAIYLYILPSLYADSSEAYSLLNKAYAGSDVFISASYISPAILSSLRLQQTTNLYRESGDTTALWVINPATGAPDSFHYPGFLEDNYFRKMDTAVTFVLGVNSQGKPNFVRFSYAGGGNIYLHLSPFAFSNFFLLYKQNIRYYENALSFLPETAGYVQWNNYFRARRSNFSALGFLWKQPALKWAILMTIALCCILFFIESRRRQRMIPVISPLRNSSVDFVSTVGRLYFQQKNHKNLAQKMIQHFMDYIRSRYQVSTSALDDNFVQQLARKSGIPEQVWRDLVEHIRDIEYYDSISEQALLELSNKIEQLKT